MKRHKGLYIAILCILLVLVIIIGRLIVPGDNVEKIGPPPDKTPQNIVPSFADTNTIATSSAQAEENKKIAACAEKGKADATANKTNYEPGMVIARFNTDVSLPEAETVLKLYGATSTDQTQAANYSSQHILTASIPKGFEFVTVCELSADAHVKFSSLDVVFSLHE